jgi:hypothetical protein
MRTEVELRRQVYRRSARKDIGALDAIEELLAEAVDEAEVRALERLRAGDACLPPASRTTPLSRVSPRASTPGVPRQG